MNQSRNKRGTLLVYLLICFLQGIGAAWHWPSIGAFTTFSLLFSFLTLLCYVRWFVLDAQEQKYQFSKPMFITLVALTVLVAPFYFFQTRGKDGWMPLLRAAGFALLCAITGSVGSVPGEAAFHSVGK